MKKVYLFLLIALLVSNAFSQEKKFVVINNHEGRFKAYEIKKETIQSHKYELMEVDNPEYLEVKQKIDSLENEISVLENKKLISGEETGILSNETKSYLEEAKENLKKAIDDSSVDVDLDNPLSTLGSLASSSKGKYLKKAKEYLDKSGYTFNQSTKGKNTTAEAKNNIQKIDELFSNSQQALSSINNRINSITNDIKKLKMKIGEAGSSFGYEKIDKKVKVYQPVENIDREIVYVDTTNNVGTNLEGTFVAFSNSSVSGYYLIEENYNEFIKNELVPKEEFNEKVTNIHISNRIKTSFTDYDSRYNSENTYIFKNADENKFYFTEDNFLGNCAIEEDLFKALSFLEESGGKYYDEDDELWVEFKGEKCMFTPIIKTSLAQKDISIIGKMYKSVEQHKVYKNQASDLTVKMVKYMDKYLSLLLSTEDIENWKKITIECSNLIDKMGNLPFADTQEYYKQTRYENNSGHKFADIIDSCKGSKKMLGL